MNKFSQIFQYEFLHFIRSPFKVATLLLFLFAIIYGCHNGYVLYKTQIEQIRSIEYENKQSISNMILQYDLFCQSQTEAES